MIIGIIAVVIFLSILVIVHELGHFLAAKKFGLLVEEFGFGLPSKRLWSKKIGETTYSINLLPLGGFVKIFGENRETDELRDRNFSFKPIWQRAVILSAGVVFNFVLGWLLISTIFFVGSPKAIFVTDISQNSPASAIGLKINDKILGFNNSQVLIDFINSHRNQEINFQVERASGDGGQSKKILNFKVMPRLNPPAGQGSLGVKLIDAGFEKQGFFQSIWQGLKTSFELSQLIFITIFHLIAQVFIGRGSLAGFAGPVGIVKLANQAGQLGWIYLFQLLALISVNLAALNIFPFPALDGGRLIFLLIEKIKGSPVNSKIEQIVNTAGLFILMIFMVVITIKDVIH